MHRLDLATVQLTALKSALRLLRDLCAEREMGAAVRAESARNPAFDLRVTEHWKAERETAEELFTLICSAALIEEHMR